MSGTEPDREPVAAAVLPSSRLRTRLRMYTMMFGSTLTIKTVRYAIPMIAPCEFTNPLIILSVVR